MTNKYTPVIGLEVHAELSTNSKMFCSCANNPFGASKPNIHTCVVCLGMPGGLPAPNKKAIDWTIQLGLALDCKINQFSKFDRKNYFYPDLAKGYQISQYDIPFCIDGKINTSEGVVRIHRIHLEEDTGKLIHDNIKNKEVSLIDFNRCGVPLVEVVTEPDIKTGTQAKEYGKKLRQIMRYLGIAECKMAEGGMRLEANISLQKPGQTKLPDYKVEVKNINSFRFLEQAIEFEIQRQAKILDENNIPVQETRGWDATNSRTFSQRSKEDVADYRYFPDPDIPPIELTQDHIETLRSKLPELPDQIRDRWKNNYQIDEKSILILLREKIVADLLEVVFILAQKQEVQPRRIANDFVNKKINLPELSLIKTAQLNQLAQQILDEYFKDRKTTQVELSQLEDIMTEVLANNKDAVAKYRSGKTQVLGFLMGQVMTKLKHKPDPAQIKEAILKALK